LVYEKPTGLCFCVYGTKIDFDNWDQLKECFDFTDEEEEQEQYVTDIDGYPVKHLNVQPLYENNQILYKKEQSEIVFAAGFYVISNNGFWTTRFCPKQSTLARKDHKGPFKDRFEADQITRIQNRNEKK
jgi:hypothetical protein